MKLTQRQISFWIGMAVVGLILAIPLSFLSWRVRLANNVNRHLAAIRAAGLPTSGTELNSYYTSVPDAENAALVMIKAFALMRDFPDNRSNEIARIEMPSRHHSMSNHETALLTEYIDLNSNALAMARSAARLNRSRYPVDYSPGFETLLPHLARLKQLARLEEFHSALAVDAGSAAEATEASIEILNMARSLDDDPSLIAQLVRMALIGMSHKSFERRANLVGFTSNELGAIATAYAAVDKTNLLSRALIGERALGIPHFRMSWSQIKRLGQGDPTDENDFDRLPDSDQQPGFLKATGFFERDLLLYLQTMETNITVAALPPPQNLLGKALIEKASDEARNRYCILSAMVLPALAKATERAAESEARVRLANTAIAVEKFQLANDRFPRALDELVPNCLRLLPSDPFDGQHLRYKILERGYVIYSVGKDRHDDGGRERPQRVKSTDKATYDITFTVER